jgi:hypothetical protein
MNTKTTAVEFLFEKLWETTKDKLTWHSILEQAKEMDKKQRIEDMNKMQIIDDVDWDGDVTFIFNNIEQYYKETYE